MDGRMGVTLMKLAIYSYSYYYFLISLRLSEDDALLSWILCKAQYKIITAFEIALVVLNLHNEVFFSVLAVSSKRELFFIFDPSSFWLSSSSSSVSHHIPATNRISHCTDTSCIVLNRGDQHRFIYHYH